MKGLMLYYSGTGNTKLAVDYLASKMPESVWSFHNFLSDGKPDITGYDIVGIAAWADFLGPPLILKKYLADLDGNGMPAFVFNTYGNLSGKTLLVMKKWAIQRGFNIVGGHSLHTPENFPPLIAGGMGRENAPSPLELSAFDNFISELNLWGKERSTKISFTKSSFFIPLFPRRMSKLFMSSKKCNKDMCTKCGICAEVCPYDAVVLNPYPVFDEKKCNACWACYNKCPVNAISAGKYSNKGMYKTPHSNLVKKLG